MTNYFCNLSLSFNFQNKPETYPRISTTRPVQIKCWTNKYQLFVYNILHAMKLCKWWMLIIIFPGIKILLVSKMHQEFEARFYLCRIFNLKDIEKSALVYFRKTFYGWCHQILTWLHIPSPMSVNFTKFQFKKRKNARGNNLLSSALISQCGKQTKREKETFEGNVNTSYFLFQPFF